MKRFKSNVPIHFFQTQYSLTFLTPIRDRWSFSSFFNMLMRQLSSNYTYCHLVMCAFKKKLHVADRAKSFGILSAAATAASVECMGCSVFSKAITVITVRQKKEKKKKGFFLFFFFLSLCLVAFTAKVVRFGN